MAVVELGILSLRSKMTDVATARRNGKEFFVLTKKLLTGNEKSGKITTSEYVKRATVEEKAKNEGVAVNEILALIASFIAMGFVVAAYFMKKKEYYLLCQLICVVCLIISYIFSAQYFAMIGLSVGMFRTLTFFYYEKRETVAPIVWSFLFSALTLAAYFIVNLAILKTAQPLDILCLVGLIMYAFIFRIRNLRIVRFAMLIPTVLFVLFNALTGAAIFATLTYAFELGANLTAIVKNHILEHSKPKSKC